jgi:hypothetical protein
LIGFIRSSNRLLGFNFHFLNAVNAAAASPTTEATTIIAMSVVLLIPDVDVDCFEAAADTDEEDEAVRVAVVILAREEWVTTTVLGSIAVAEERTVLGLFRDGDDDGMTSVDGDVMAESVISPYP